MLPRSGHVIPRGRGGCGIGGYAALLHRSLSGGPLPDCPASFIHGPRHAVLSVATIMFVGCWLLGYSDAVPVPGSRLQGTLDDTSFLAVPAALAFVKEMGGAAAIAAHNHELAGWAATMLAERWNTELYAPLELCTSMAVVRCPFEPVAPGEDLMGLMSDRFGIVVPIIPMPGAHGVWARISAQLYNDKADYDRLADAVLELQRERA